MIIPNAVAVSTGGEKYMFTSFLYRDHAYGVMTQAWNKASHRNSIHMVLHITFSHFNRKDATYVI